MNKFFENNKGDTIPQFSKKLLERAIKTQTPEKNVIVKGKKNTVKDKTLIVVLFKKFGSQINAAFKKIKRNARSKKLKSQLVYTLSHLNVATQLKRVFFTKLTRLYHIQQQQQNNNIQISTQTNIKKNKKVSIIRIKNILGRILQKNCKKIIAYSSKINFCKKAAESILNHLDNKYRKNFKLVFTNIKKFNLSVKNRSKKFCNILHQYFKTRQMSHFTKIRFAIRTSDTTKVTRKKSIEKSEPTSPIQSIQEQINLQIQQEQIKELQKNIINEQNRTETIKKLQQKQNGNVIAQNYNQQYHHQLLKSLYIKYMDLNEQTVSKGTLLAEHKLNLDILNNRPQHLLSVNQNLKREVAVIQQSICPEYSSWLSAIIKKNQNVLSLQKENKDIRQLMQSYVQKTYVNRKLLDLRSISNKLMSILSIQNQLSVQQQQ